MFFSKCPRCGDYAFEALDGHGFCVQCNFFPEEWDEDAGRLIPRWAEKALRGDGNHRTIDLEISEVATQGSVDEAA